LQEASELALPPSPLAVLRYGLSKAIVNNALKALSTSWLVDLLINYLFEKERDFEGAGFESHRV